VKRLEKEQAACPPTPSRPSLTPFKSSVRITADSTEQPAHDTLEALKNKLAQRDQEIKVCTLRHTVYVGDRRRYGTGMCCDWEENFATLYSNILCIGTGTTLG
jgi:hypothetical protein